MKDPGLSDHLLRAIGERKEHLDAIGRDSGEHPVEVTFHYHPQMDKIDVHVRASYVLPSVHVNRRRPTNDDHAHEVPVDLSAAADGG